MLAICLVLSDCDPQTSIAKVIERVEGYQRLHACYFGVSDADFGMALIWLAILRDEIDMHNLEQAMDILGKIPLRQWIQPMLAFNSVYFNDEGESWDAESETASFAEHNRPLREFFAQPANLNREAIAAFFAARGIGENTVYQWSSLGSRDVRCEI